MSDDARWVIQLSLGFTFALSAISKLRAPISFIRGVREYQVLPPKIAELFAAFVIFAETFLAVSHLSGQMLRTAVPLGFVVLGIFAAGVVLNLMRHRDLPCFCFGTGEELISGRTLARLGITSLGELTLMLKPGFFSTSFARSSLTASVHEVVIAIAWAVFLLVAVLWVLEMPGLLQLARGRFTGELDIQPRADEQGVSA